MDHLEAARVMLDLADQDHAEFALLHTGDPAGVTFGRLPACLVEPHAHVRAGRAFQH